MRKQRLYGASLAMLAAAGGTFLYRSGVDHPGGAAGAPPGGHATDAGSSSTHQATLTDYMVSAQDLQNLWDLAVLYNSDPTQHQFLPQEAFAWIFAASGGQPPANSDPNIQNLWAFVALYNSDPAQYQVIPQHWLQWVYAEASGQSTADSDGGAGSSQALPASTNPASSSTPVPTTTTSGNAVSSGSGGAGGAWAALRQCESGGNYSENTGNGFYGAYQFALSTWQSLGYSGVPSEAPPAVQDQAAQQLQAQDGWGPWPACSAQLGL